SARPPPPCPARPQPMLRLAGLRINPRTNGAHRPPRVVGLSLVSLGDGKWTELVLPAGLGFSTPVWAPDGRRFAFTATDEDAIRLCYVKGDDAVQSCRAFRLN